MRSDRDVPLGQLVDLRPSVTPVAVEHVGSSSRVGEVPPAAPRDPSVYCCEEGVVEHGSGRGILGLEHTLRHRLQQRHVAARPDLQVLVGQRRAPCPMMPPSASAGSCTGFSPASGSGFTATIVAPLLLRVFEGGEHARMVRARVLAHDDDQIWPALEVVVRDGRLADSDGLAERRSGGFVAHVRAVGQVVRAECAHEQLVDERGLVRRAPARVEGRLVGSGAARSADRGDERERLVPSEMGS